MFSEAAVDNCPERMHAADAEVPRIETVVEFCSGMGVETAVRMQAVSLETVEISFWCSRKRRNKKKQELKAAG